LLVHDWSKCITWLNIPQPKLGNIREYFLIFKTAHVAKNIWRIINIVASIWRWKWTSSVPRSSQFSSSSRKTFRFSEQIMSVDKYPSLFLCQMEAIVYITNISRNLRYMHAWCNPYDAIWTDVMEVHEWHGCDWCSWMIQFTTLVQESLEIFKRYCKNP